MNLLLETASRLGCAPSFYWRSAAGDLYAVGDTHRGNVFFDPARRVRVVDCLIGKIDFDIVRADKVFGADALKFLCRHFPFLTR
ncbi:MAG: hypothetical protein LBR07_09955 [Puniceicoccales bacterium]|nr:hypothetical protein [Puniceicoccales bacterium]